MSPESFEQRPAPDAADEAIELDAAEWIVLRDRGFTAEQQREFDRWLAADERHARAYARLTETWHLLDDVPAERVPLPAPCRRPWFWVAGSLAAAAAVALAIYRPATLAPEVEAAPTRATTPIGGFKTLTLADGSTVRLNTASEITVEFSATERRVTLSRGEASFDVAKDPARPFIVRVGEVDVCAVGTVFNVRHDERAIEVLVVEGKVRVDPVVAASVSEWRRVDSPALPANPITDPERSETIATPGATPLLTAGQRATIVRPNGSVPATASVATVAPDESARALAWHSRQLEFSQEPLANIAAEFNRYNRHRLVIEDPELGAQRFGGKFPADDFASLVRLLELNFGVVAERRENETVLRRRPAGR